MSLLPQIFSTQISRSEIDVHVIRESPIWFVGTFPCHEVACVGGQHLFVPNVKLDGIAISIDWDDATDPKIWMLAKPLGKAKRKEFAELTSRFATSQEYPGPTAHVLMYNFESWLAHLWFSTITV